VVQLTRVLALATVAAFVALSADNLRARAEEASQRYSHFTADDCHQQRRALSRRACQARLKDEMPIDTAEKN
jgi:hypothetical protein